MQDYRHILIAAGHSPGFVRQLWAHVLRAQGPAARRYVAYWQRLCLAEEAKAQAARIAVSGVLSDPVAAFVAGYQAARGAEMDIVDVALVDAVTAIRSERAAA